MLLHRSLIETENYIVAELPIERQPADFFWACLEYDSPVLLESSLVDGRLGRYSVIGVEPFATLSSRDGLVSVRKGKKTESYEGDPFDALSRMLSQLKCRESMDDEAPPFVGGAIGYISYDAGRLIEKLPSTAADDRRIPDLQLGFYDSLIVYDHLQGTLYATAYIKPGEKREEAARRLERLSRICKKKLLYRYRPFLTRRNMMRSTFSRRAYLATVELAKRHIGEGDIFQVNLSQRFTLPSHGHPYGLYQRLRQTNPAPFSAFLDFGDVALVSSSPERFMRCTNSVVETSPIKGTRPRGATIAEDDRLAFELLASEKDAAEHVMIVDVERNDLGRVCIPGSVRADRLKELESYSTVHHLVSTVTGRLASGCGSVELLKAGFPGGSITGAPKIRAMELIERFEPVRRGVYTGSIVYFGFDGYLDSSIVIRTFVMKRQRFSNGILDFHVGGGIVADSDPAEEYQETLDKAKGLLNALGVSDENIS